jgi:hypothetical protein
MRTTDLSQEAATEIPHNNGVLVAELLFDTPMTGG